MEQPQVARQGPRTWVVVAVTLGAVLGAALLFVAGLVTGIAVSGSTQGTAAAPVPVPGGGSTSGGTDGGASGGSGGSGSLDDCLVGTWRTVEHSESAKTDQGTVTISGVDRTLEITADGTETVTYGSTPAQVATDQGEGQAVYSGTVVYGVRTDGGSMSFDLRSSDGTLTVTVAGSDPKQQELKPGAGSVSYTCDGDRFTQEATGYRSVMERVS
ncbi:hypothetical protein [Phycicoccus flavus]|uniref:hypothetical protein n=1 Tax=Phycicoccus flavus TaxID=2502783 RepID=UPI000FEBAE04|nr:hypothetical protein [Phycicoccus flavus]NHA69471.1 hypothetical protein [Phycicoccus flavus]